MNGNLDEKTKKDAPDSEVALNTTSQNKIDEQWKVGRKPPYVKSYSGIEKTLVFPSIVGKTKVTGIANDFEFISEDEDYQENIEEIVIPEGYTYIGEAAFSGCFKLKKVTLPSTLTSIGRAAFSRCNSLESIAIPDSVTELGSYSFNGCSKLKCLLLPPHLQSIGSGAFGDCTELREITIPKETSLGNGAFERCYKLADDSGMLIINGILFGYFGREKKVVVPPCVREISYGAFACNEYVTSVTLSDSVTLIGNDAFASCTSLNEIHLPTSIVEIGCDAFRECNNLREIVIPPKVTFIYPYCFMRCHNLINIQIPDGVTTIRYNAFMKCSSLEEIDLPKSVEIIEMEAFKDSGIKTLIIRNPALVMHKKSLMGCSGYTIYAPEGSLVSTVFPSRTKVLENYDGK